MNASNPASLPTKPEQRRQPGHRGGRRSGGDRAAAHRRPQPGELAHVPGAGGVVDDAGDEEQRRLEQAVREQHRDPGDGRDPGAGAEQHHEEPELAHGAEREQPLEVVLGHRAPAADHHRGQAEHDDGHPPHGDVRESRRESGHEVHARLHHRRRVQVGADRGRRGHRGREPGVEGQLGRLRQRADEDQRERGRDRAAAEAARLPERDDLRDPVGAGRLAEQDEPQQHHQPAEHRHQQRLDRRAPVLPRLAALAHEQERRHRRQLPEQVQREQVVGEDEPEHHAGEGEQERGAAGGVGRALAEVADAVDEDQRADPGDEHDHRQRQGVEPETQGEPELRRPVQGAC